MAPPRAMSAFERKRLENISVNQEIIKDISSTSLKVAPSPVRVESTASSRPKRRSEPVKRESSRPTRQSSRLAGLGAEDETVKRKFEDAVQAQADAERAKKVRVSGDLTLGDIVVEGKKWEGGGGLKGLVRGAQPGLRTFTEDDVKETTDSAIKELIAGLGQLNLYEKWAPNDIKITPQRVYSLGFHPTEDKPIIFAGDKEGAMGVFDASQKGPEVEDDEDEEAEFQPPAISVFKGHSRTITAFAFSPTDSNALFSSSYDSSIRKVDLEKETSVQVFAPEDPDEDLPISALEISSTEPSLMFFSTLDGYLGRHDVRAPKSNELWRLSNNKIGGFSLHPLQPHFVATASLDRTFKVWDLRKITGKGELCHPALLGEHESRLSVSHASWSAGGHVATSSYDDTVKIYDFTDCSSWAPGHDIGTKGMKPSATVSHNNQTGRWVTILKPQWQRRPRDGIQKFAIGNMNRFVDLFASDGSQIAQLGGDGISAVPAVAHFHPSLNWVAGGTASGKLCLWM